MDDLATRIKDIRVQFYRAASRVGLPPMDFNKYHNVAIPSHRRKLIWVVKDFSYPIHSIPPWQELIWQVYKRLKEHQKEL